METNRPSHITISRSVRQHPSHNTPKVQRTAAALKSRGVSELDVGVAGVPGVAVTRANDRPPDYRADALRLTWPQPATPATLPTSSVTGDRVSSLRFASRTVSRPDPTGPSSSSRTFGLAPASRCSTASGCDWYQLVDSRRPAESLESTLWTSGEVRLRSRVSAAPALTASSSASSCADPMCSMPSPSLHRFMTERISIESEMPLNRSSVSGSSLVIVK